MNEEYWRLRALNVALNILKGQENGTITRTEIDDMNRNIQITKLCYNDGYNEGFQKGKLQAQKEEEGFLISIDNYYGFEDCMIELHERLQKRIKQLQKEIGGMK